ncbi:hypothetical protein [Bradyrhizobium sp. CCBAU 45321]|nr:hypothetical protein [Bradyrhizobium sp. CCBAU 45321]
MRGRNPVPNGAGSGKMVQTAIARPEMTQIKIDRPETCYPAV